MPEDQNKPKPGEGAKSDAAATNVSPSLSDVTEGPPAKPGDPTKPKTDERIHADPLSDGTVPTVLTPGDSHRSVPKKQASINALYRKADITTTLVTFLGVAVAGGLIVGGYVYFAGPKNNKAAPPPKVSSLNSQSLQTLNDFFGGNSAGTSSQVLTVNPSSLFENRVGIASDLKVTGATTLSGPTSLGQLVVDQSSELGVTDIRGSLTVAGPVNFESPLVVSGATAVKGNLSATGNGSFGGTLSAGSISVSSLSVTGSLNIDNNLTIGGAQASGGGGSSVQGNDSAGTVTASIGANPANGNIASVNFRTAFSAIPIINITPLDAASAKIEPYVTASASGFTIGGAGVGGSGTIPSGTYAFNYWVVQY